MLRNVNQTTLFSIKNGLIKNKLIFNSNNLINSRDCTKINIKVNKNPSIERTKYYATYFYNLANNYYKNKNGYDYESLKSDLFFEFNFKEMVNFLNNTNIKENSNIVDKLSILRSLQIIGVPDKDEIICKLIEDLSANLDKITLEKALKVLLNQVQYQNGKLQKFFIQSLVKRIENAEDEINDFAIALMIYNEKIIHLFSNDFLKKLDNKAVSLCKKSTENNSLVQQEVTWILHRLSLTKRRPKPMIQYLTNCLNETDLHNLELNFIISLINSLANINYLSVKLLSKIVNHLIEVNFVSKINKFDFNLLLKNFIKLRFDPVEFFDYLACNSQLINDKLGKKCLMNIISTMAFFNYSKEKAFNLLDDSIMKGIDIDLLKDNVLRIEYLWALSFYDCLDKVPYDQFTLNYFTKILEKPHFYYLRPRFALLYNYCKLNLGLDWKLPDKYLYQTTNKEKNNLKADDFLSILAKENYLTDVDTELGFKFDLVFLCNKHFETKAIKSLENAKQLCDEQYKLIYVYFLSLKEVALNTSKLLGEVYMMKSLGKQLDYRIVLVNPHEIINKTSIDIVKEFRQSVIDLI